MKTEERVQSYTTQVEPTTGDKRRRDDQDTKPQPPPSSRASSGSGNQNAMNGSYMQPQQMSNSQGPGMNDSLYIGDLQWVCKSRLLACPLTDTHFLSLHAVDD